MKKIIFITLLVTLATKSYSQTVKEHWDNGLIAWQLGNHQAAAEEFTKAIKLNPNNDTLYNYRGICEFELDDYQKAIKDFNMVIKLNPKYASAYYMRGFCEQQQMCLDLSKAKELGDKSASEMISKYCK